MGAVVQLFNAVSTQRKKAAPKAPIPNPQGTYKLSRSTWQSRVHAEIEHTKSAFLDALEPGATEAPAKRAKKTNADDLEVCDADADA